MTINIILVKSFTTDKDLGNPAGVILDADQLTDAQMQDIAFRLKFSESVFVLKSQNADYRMRYFSAVKEVDFCAHATVAACYVISAVDSIETCTGIVNVDVNKNSGLVTLWQTKPVFGATINKAFIAPLLGIAVDNISSKVPCQIVSTGVPKLIIPVLSLEVLLSIKPDFEGIKQFCIDSGARGFYPFTTEVLIADSHFHARQFNPLAGIDEDPITGIAAGALGAYWDHHHNECHASYIIEQGHSIQKFGRVYVTTAEDGVAISGYAVIFDQITLAKTWPTAEAFNLIR